MKPKQLWLALVPAMTVPCLGALLYFVAFDESGVARVLYGGTKGFTLLWPLLATLWLLGERLPRPAVGARDLRAAGWGLLSGLGIAAAMFGLMQTPVANVLARGVPQIRAKVETFGVLEHYWLFSLLLSTVHALLEEYYWRWFVYGRLRQALGRTWWAHGLAGAAFASHHVVITSQYFGLAWGVGLGLFVGVGGVIWSRMYERQGTLIGAWVSHVLVDLGIFAVGYRMLFGAG